MQKVQDLEVVLAKKQTEVRRLRVSVLTVTILQPRDAV